MGYTNRRTLTIDHTKCGASDSSNFPVLFSGTYAYLATVANGGNVTNANGYDIIFTSDAAGVTKLDHEIETYTAASGLVNFWVRVPTVSKTTDTVIYLWYGNAAITTSQENVTGVWDANFSVVGHFPNGSSLTVLDSTSNANNGTLHNTPTAVAGKVDGGVDVAASSSQYITFTNNTNLNVTNAKTFEIWLNRRATTTVLPRVFTQVTDGNNYWEVLIPDVGSQSTDGDSITAWVVNAGTTAKQRSPGGSVNSAGTWYHVVVVFTSTPSISAIYINGTSQSLSTPSGTYVAGPTAGVFLGIRDDLARAFDGQLDEFRVSTVARSADWITTEYNNQSSPSTFYAVGDASTFLTPLVGALTAAGVAAVAVAGTVLTPLVGALTATAFAASLVLGTPLTPNVGSLNLTGIAPQAVSRTILTPGNTALIVSGQQAQLNNSMMPTLTPLTGSLVATGIAPNLLLDVRLSPSVGSLAIATQTPIAVRGTILSPSQGVLAVSGAAPVGVQGYILTPGSASLALTGIAPIGIVATLLTPPTGALALTGQTPMRVTGALRIPGTGALMLTGIAPTLASSQLPVIPNAIQSRYKPRALFTLTIGAVTKRYSTKDVEVP